MSTLAVPSRNRTRPYVQIVEQPSRSLRYRYIKEKRPGTISGASSTATQKIPFSIQVVGCEGKVAVIVSCVTKDKPYKPHPHSLVGPNCRDGICYFETEVSERSSVVTFPKLAVQCAKRNEVADNLKIRENKNTDPFRTGFAHKENVKAIDLHVVRLCVQVFLKNEKTVPLTPVVSDPVHNKKTLQDPVIYRLSHCNSPVNGRDDDIILLCTKIAKEDIKIRFFQSLNEQLIWEAFASFSTNHIYNNSSICFRPPKYHNQNISEPVRVLVQLVRPSDGLGSPTVDFEYLPLETVPGALKDKRKRNNNMYNSFEEFMRSLSVETTPSPQETKQTWSFPEVVPNLNVPITITLNDMNMQPNEVTLDPMDMEPSTSKVPFWDAPEVPNLNLPITVGEINEQLSTGGTNDLSFSGTNVNLENASGVGQILNIDYNQIHLEPIHLSSGDLEMPDVDRLSGSLQELIL